VDEAARLATLRSKFVLDTAPDDTLDALVSMCAEMFDVPVALVSLVDERRQWFKARKNFDATQTGRAESFCAWTTLCIERKVLVVRDATADEKFKDNPIVTGDPGVRFYAGAPLVVDDVVLGALCLIDFEPHLDEKFFDEAAARRLRAVAQTVATHLARPSFGTWLGAAIDTVREGVLLLEHAAAGKEKDKGKEEREELTHGVFDSVDEYMATEMLRDAPTRVEIRDFGRFEPGLPGATNTVVFANAAAKRMLRADVNYVDVRNQKWGEKRRATGTEPPPPPSPISRMFRNPSEESFVPRVPRGVEGLDLVRAFPGPPETAATLARVSALLAKDAARRRSRRAGEHGEVCENTEALMQGKARKSQEQSREHSSQSQSLARSASTKSIPMDTEGESVSGESGGRVREDLGTTSERLRKCAPATPMAPVEIDADFVDGRRRVELSFTNVPMDALGCPATLVHVRDVTEEHESRRMLMNAKARSDAAVEAKSSFLANTSHEIRTPLNAIIAGSELLGEITEGLTGDQVELIDMVTRAGKTLLSIVNDVLDFSKIEADKLTLEHRPFVLENCVDLSFEMQSIKANAKELVLNYSIDDSVPWGLVGDEARLRQVVTNLISNAVKFTPERGSVVLRVRALEEHEDSRDVLYASTATRGGDAGKRGRRAMERSAGDDAASPEEDRRSTKSRRSFGSRGDALEREERVPDVARDSRARTHSMHHPHAIGHASKEEDDDSHVRLLFEVTDTGAGLSPRDRASLFTAFEQVNKSRTRREGGTGLGLVISMRLVRLMGGDMAATSEGRGKGSRFAFVVRLRRRDAQPKNARGKSKNSREMTRTLSSGSFDGRRSLEGLEPSSGILRGRRVDVISTCASFCHSADFFISGAGLETNFPSPEETAELVGAAARGEPLRFFFGDEPPAAILVDREFAPRSAFAPDLFSCETMVMENDASAHARVESRLLDACDEFVGALRAEREKANENDAGAFSATSPPSVLVLTFAPTACDVGIPGEVSIVTKPLVNGKFQRWVEGLVARHTGDAANATANARWDAKHARVCEGGASGFGVTDGDVATEGVRALTPSSPRNFAVGSQPADLGFGSKTSPPRGGKFGSLQKRGSLVNLAALETRADETEVSDLDPEAKRRVRVLLAEDNAVNQKVATKILHALGFFCAVAGDGEQAVARFVEHAERGEPFDVVLMDLQMPVMDGVEAARAILGREVGEVGAAKPKIFALTADVAASVIQECRDAGMDGFLGKPIDRVRLGRVLRDVTKWVAKGRPEAFHAERTWEVT
jgi:signal transduction histidine kinase/CheY-like chemotaxis protein